MHFFTVGYGGREPEQFLDLLVTSGVRAVADVRLRPDRASMGAYQKAKTPDKGIQRLLSSRGIEYRSLPELGNLFLEFSDWVERYQRLMQAAGPLLTDRVTTLPGPWCLLCAEKRVEDCHRGQIADHLVAAKGWAVTHL